ncbi:MAG: hypothetical protein ACUVQ6_00340 [Dissulfurimicrobium sp.]|uniref:hypothetical protein n=1 Tax=Dissulfurimicrobium sp. TaxID=2022436 RepID=UPI00404A464A
MTKTEPDAGFNEFEIEIDSAIDELFNPSKQIEIDPVTSQIIDVKTSLNEAPAAAEGQLLDMKETIERCQQHLLTLEWEVTDTNIRLLRDAILKLLSALAPDKKQLLGDLPSLMDKVLDIMLISPDTMPMDAIKSLQKGLDAIKEMISEGPLWFEMVNSSINRLNELILSAETAPSNQQPSGVDMQGHVPGAETLEAEEIDMAELEMDEEGTPQADASFHDHAPDAARQGPQPAAINETDIQPVPAITLNDASHITLKPDSSAMAPVITSEIKAQISAHIDALDRCIARMLPIEQLMARTHGMEKLYIFYKGIREDLAGQIAVICNAFPDISRPLHASKPDATVVGAYLEDRTNEPFQMMAEDDYMAKQKDKQAKCPWQRLAMTSWGGKTVAFVPDEIAFEGRAAWWARKKIRRLHSMPLKMLKAWPWTKIGPLLNGRLAKKDEKELSDMEFPVIDPPWATSLSSGREAMVIILYASGKGSVLLTDSETILFSTYGDWNWKPGEGGAPNSPGVLTNSRGESIPVITLKGLPE